MAPAPRRARAVNTYRLTASSSRDRNSEIISAAETAIMAPSVASRKNPGTALAGDSPGRRSARLASRLSPAAASRTTSTTMAKPSRVKAPSRIVIVCLNCVASARTAPATAISAIVLVVPGANLASRKTRSAPASSHSSGEKARRFPNVLTRRLARASSARRS